VEIVIVHIQGLRHLCRYALYSLSVSIFVVDEYMYREVGPQSHRMRAAGSHCCGSGEGEMVKRSGRKGYWRWCTCPSCCQWRGTYK